jgi:hypothetical protein
MYKKVFYQLYEELDVVVAQEVIDILHNIEDYSFRRNNQN